MMGLSDAGSAWSRSEMVALAAGLLIFFLLQSPYLNAPIAASSPDRPAHPAEGDPSKTVPAQPGTPFEGEKNFLDAQFWVFTTSHAKEGLSVTHGLPVWHVNADHTLAVHNSHPPTVALLEYGASWFFGPTPYAVRLPAVIFSVLMLFFLYALLRRAFPQPAAGLAVLGLFVQPMFFHFASCPEVFLLGHLPLLILLYLTLKLAPAPAAAPTPQPFPAPVHRPWPRLAGLALTSAACLFISYATLGVLALWVLAWTLTRRNRAAFRDAAAVVVGAAVALAVLLLWLNWGGGSVAHWAERGFLRALSSQADRADAAAEPAVTWTALLAHQWFWIFKGASWLAELGLLGLGLGLIGFLRSDEPPTPATPPTPPTQPVPLTAPMDAGEPAIHSSEPAPLSSEPATLSGVPATLPTDPVAPGATAVAPDLTEPPATTPALATPAPATPALATPTPATSAPATLGPVATQKILFGAFALLFLCEGFLIRQNAFTHAYSVAGAGFLIAFGLASIGEHAVLGFQALNIRRGFKTRYLVAIVLVIAVLGAIYRLTDQLDAQVELSRQNDMTALATAIDTAQLAHANQPVLVYPAWLLPARTVTGTDLPPNQGYIFPWFYRGRAFKCEALADLSTDWFAEKDRPPVVLWPASEPMAPVAMVAASRKATADGSPDASALAVQVQAMDLEVQAALNARGYQHQTIGGVTIFSLPSNPAARNPKP